VALGKNKLVHFIVVVILKPQTEAQLTTNNGFTNFKKKTIVLLVCSKNKKAKYID
jgi:hypothetical protein